MIASNLVDEFDLDVVTLDIFCIVLRSPYLYDRKEILFHYETEYHLMKDEVEYFVRAHCAKLIPIL